jgi:hypothetical protein
MAYSAYGNHKGAGESREGKSGKDQESVKNLPQAPDSPRLTPQERASRNGAQQDETNPAPAQNGSDESVAKTGQPDPAEG